MTSYIRCSWLFRTMNRQRIKPLIPDAAYYWLLDRLSDNGGWRPLSMRHPEWFGRKP